MNNIQNSNSDVSAENGTKPNVGCCTSMNELIQWCILNAFNIEGQDGTKYVAIDYEEMRTQLDYFVEKEKHKELAEFERIKAKYGIEINQQPCKPNES